MATSSVEASHPRRTGESEQGVCMSPHLSTTDKCVISTAYHRNTKFTKMTVTVDKKYVDAGMVDLEGIMFLRVYHHENVNFGRTVNVHLNKAHRQSIGLKLANGVYEFGGGNGGHGGSSNKKGVWKIFIDPVASNPYFYYYEVFGKNAFETLKDTEKDRFRTAMRNGQCSALGTLIDNLNEEQFESETSNIPGRITALQGRKGDITTECTETAKKPGSIWLKEAVKLTVREYGVWEGYDGGQSTTKNNFENNDNLNWTHFSERIYYIHDHESPFWNTDQHGGTITVTTNAPTINTPPPPPPSTSGTSTSRTSTTTRRSSSSSSSKKTVQEPVVQEQEEAVQEDTISKPAFQCNNFDTPPNEIDFVLYIGGGDSSESYPCENASEDTLETIQAPMSLFACYTSDNPPKKTDFVIHIGSGDTIDTYLCMYPQT